MTLHYMDGCEAYNDQSSFEQKVQSLVVPRFAQFGTATIITGRLQGKAVDIPISTTETEKFKFSLSPGSALISDFITDPMILGLAIRIVTLPTGLISMPIMRAVASPNDPGCEVLLRMDGAGGTFRFDHYKGFFGVASPTLLVSSANDPFALNTWVYLEIRMFCNDVTGTCDIRVNTSSILTFGPGNNGPPAVDDDILVSQQIFFTGTSGEVHIDDIYHLLDDGLGRTTYLGDSVVETLRPSSDGATTDWAPNTGTEHYLLVDEIGFDGDTTYVSTISVSDIELFNVADLVFVVGQIWGTSVTTSERLEGAGTREIQHVYRSPAPVLTNGPTLTVDSQSYESHLTIWEQNPDTAANWTPAEIDAAQFGLELTL